jgi:hypothetical protein
MSEELYCLRLLPTSDGLWCSGGSSECKEVRVDKSGLVLTVILVVIDAVTVTDYLTGNTSSMAVGKLRYRNSPVERTNIQL